MNRYELGALLLANSVANLKRSSSSFDLQEICVDLQTPLIQKTLCRVLQFPTNLVVHACAVHVHKQVDIAVSCAVAPLASETRLDGIPADVCAD